MKFTKMNGAGNDFIIINNIEEGLPAEVFSPLAARLCRRRLSIGADGLMVVDRPEGEGDYRMLFYNADGSPGEMCGNGARCIARYGCEKGLAGETQRIETAAGLVTGWRINRREYRVRLNDPSVIKLGLELSAAGRQLVCHYVELGKPGVPHAVVPLPEQESEPCLEQLRELGRELRYHSAFPKGANINFFSLVGEDELRLYTYERGVEDFTYACGTGCGSTTAVLSLLGLVSGSDVLLHMPGGDLRISLCLENGRVHNIFLTGPTNIVAEGEVTDEELRL